MLINELLGEISDETLEGYLDRLLDDRLYNSRIVPDGCENDDAQL